MMKEEILFMGARNIKDGRGNIMRAILFIKDGRGNIEELTT